VEKHNQKAVWICAVVIFLLFCGLVGWFVGVPMIRLAENPEAFRLWVDEYGVWGKLIFIGMVFIQVVVALIPGEPVELAAGFAFGFWEGTLLSMGGILMGSLVIFLLVRKFGVKLVEVFFSHKDIMQLNFLKNSKKTAVIAFLLMLIPGTPKDFLSYFAGLTKLKLWQWLLIVGIARLPSLITSTATGAAAGEKNYILAGVMLTVTALISVAGIFYYRRISKQESVPSE
jgi:uncharacterized membrane protein YdjX (TVP38/TMEM64 family)